MAFFDDLGKKITTAGQTAVQKTKDMTDIARTNSLISEEEKKVNSSYFQIGKLYVAKHLNDYEEEFAGLISIALESENKIAEYKKQIQEMKGLVCCPNCGAEVPNTIAYCSGCGAPMPRQEGKVLDDNSVRCPGCGAIVPKNMRFCTSCGTIIGEAASAPMGAPTPMGPPPPMGAPTPMGPPPPMGTPAPMGPPPPMGAPAPMGPPPPMGAPMPMGPPPMGAPAPMGPPPPMGAPVPMGQPPMGQPAPIAQPPRQAEPKPIAQPEPEPGDKKCEKCGATLEPGVDFCTECGAKLIF